jgi:hypothetical protein
MDLPALVTFRDVPVVSAVEQLRAIADALEAHLDGPDVRVTVEVKVTFRRVP